MRMIRACIAIVLATALASTGSHAYDCIPPKPGDTWTAALDGAKRIFWSSFPPAEARKRTHEAYLAVFNDIRDANLACCLPRLPAATCNAEVARAEMEVRNWNWKSPPGVINEIRRYAGAALSQYAPVAARTTEML